MIQLHEGGYYLRNGREWIPDGEAAGIPGLPSREEAEGGSIARRILRSHDKGDGQGLLRLSFDSLVSPDNNYTSILQTARASGLREFPVPYVLSNCHNTLCAVGGTTSEDDHAFGLSCAKRYGGCFVPRYRGVLHQYMRERMAGGGRMILGSDSHTRYGALGTLGFGEGGGEVAKQLLGRTYDIAPPPVVAVRLTGSPRPGVGPMDVALALVGATFRNGFNKNKILEFLGEGIDGLSVEYRMGIDVMTTESAALSSVWRTDGKARDWLALHGREEDFRLLEPGEWAHYDGLIEIDLSRVEPMMALPFHPSNVYPIREFSSRPREILEKVEEEGRKLYGQGFSLTGKLREGRLLADQALVSGCAGGMFENLCAVRDILEGYVIPGDSLGLGVNPASQPIAAELMRQGIARDLTLSGAVVRPAICGPCFGVTDVPASGQLSIRHVTRNYPGREGAQKNRGQWSCAILMDARSIAATVRRGGFITAADELETAYRDYPYRYDRTIYEKQVYSGWGHPLPEEPIRLGPGIADWPRMYPLGDHLILRVTGAYEGSVTTDDLIPSGEASAHRSDPNRISEYLLINKDRELVGRAKAVREEERLRREEGEVSARDLREALAWLREKTGDGPEKVTVGGLLSAPLLGDGSSREQAASSQKVLGGWADLAEEYATKRYRSNLINWGLLPFTAEKLPALAPGQLLVVPGIRRCLEAGESEVTGYLASEEMRPLALRLGSLTGEERQILLKGCVINHYRREQ